MPKNPVFAALGWFVVGSFVGFIAGHPPIAPMTCHAPMLRAHFLERQLAFETSALFEKSSSSASLRAAAPEELSAESTPAATQPSEVVSSTSISSISSISSASQSASASSSSAITAKPDGEAGFPAFERAVYPVGRVPNWGAMKTPAEWERDYGEMNRDEFVRLPMYDIDDLTTPMNSLLKHRDDPRSIRILTAKLFYSTRFFGSYDLDSGEFSGTHAGIDLKLPEGTPVGAIAGGRVSSVQRHESGLGLHVIIEHRLGDQTFYSIYGHLSAIGVTEGQDVAPGAYIGAVGSTGRSTGDHLHLQVDLGVPGASHAVYNPKDTPTRTEAARHTINPFSFIESHDR